MTLLDWMATYERRKWKGTGKNKIQRCHKICHALDNLTCIERNLFAARRQLATLKRTPNVGPWLFTEGNRFFQQSQQAVKKEIEALADLLQKELPPGWYLEFPEEPSKSIIKSLVYRREGAEGQAELDKLRAEAKRAKLAAEQAAQRAAQAAVEATDGSEQAKAKAEQAANDMQTALKAAQDAIEAVRAKEQELDRQEPQQETEARQ